MRWISPLCFSLILTLLSPLAMAQNPEEQEEKPPPGSNATAEYGLHLGNLLPNQIPGCTEIIGLGGVRAGFRLAPRQYVEGGVIMGNGEGVEWKNIHADLRMDIPIENLTAIAYGGADMIYYKPSTQDSNKLLFGGHVGGGLLAHLTEASWFRFDMKFGFSPGTSLYIGFGIMLRFGEAQEGGAGS
jgi:hypothetical protein